MLKKFFLNFLGYYITLIIFKIKSFFYSGYSLKVFRGFFFSKIKVKGSLSLTLNKGYVIKSKIVVSGKNNCIQFDEGVKIINCNFFISGDNCNILIKGDRIINNTKFELLEPKTVFLPSKVV